MLSGIYKIVNVINYKFYIGQAVNFNTRWRKHIYALIAGTHHNEYLQRSWNKYGEQNFTFEVLEFCKLELLTKREQFYLDTLNACKNGYNISPTAESLLGYKQTKEHIAARLASRGEYTVSDEVRARISAKLKGRPLSEETKAKMSASRKGKKQTPEWIAKRNLRYDKCKAEIPEIWR